MQAVSRVTHDPRHIQMSAPSKPGAATETSDSPEQRLAQVRHDFKTPVNQILGYSEMLGETADERGDAESAADLKRVQDASRNLLTLIERFLTPEGIAAFLPAARPEALRTAGPDTLPSHAPALPAWHTPAEPHALPAPGSALGAAAGAEAEKRTGRLLVVDDNEMNRDMLSRRLRNKGFEVEVAEGGREALDLLARKAFDLVLLDIMMPDVSGLDVLREVRHVAGRSRTDLPVIMATAKSDSQDIVDALKGGANDYVTKPIDFPVVLARVEGQLALKFASDRIRALAASLERRGELIRRTFGRYLSDEIVDQLLENPQGLELGGSKRTVTIMMSDLRGFSALAERLDPADVVTILNNYLAAMTEVIARHKGTIDEFIGDAILGLFGAPTTRADDARRAVACAIEMQLAMDGVNRFNRERGFPDIEMGIALHTGEVIAGNIGSDKRAKYGVVGTTVNLTSRIETYTVGGQILISEAVLRAAGTEVRVGGQMSVKAKGLKEPLAAFDLRGLGAPENVALPDRALHLAPQDPAIAVEFFVLDGKTVGETLHRGRFVSLAMRGARLQADVGLDVHANLKMHVLSPEGRALAGDLYAKVVPLESAAPSADAPAGCDLYFTSSPPEVETYFAQRLGKPSSH